MYAKYIQYSHKETRTTTTVEHIYTISKHN